MYLIEEMLSDMGGVFGFFLGVTMLNCLQKSWHCLAKSLTKFFLTFKDFSLSRKNENAIENIGVRQSTVMHYMTTKDKDEDEKRYEVVIRQIEKISEINDGLLTNLPDQSMKPPAYSETQ